jgi:hypothetical protein
MSKNQPSFSRVSFLVQPAASVAPADRKMQHVSPLQTLCLDLFFLSSALDIVMVLSRGDLRQVCLV